MSSLSLGKAITTILNDVCKDKVFPIVANPETTYPFIVYKRTGLTPANSKDRYNYKEMATVEVIVASENYSKSLEIAEETKSKLEHTRGVFNSIEIGEVTMTAASEDYLDDAYIQRMTYQIEIIG